MYVIWIQTVIHKFRSYVRSFVRSCYSHWLLFISIVGHTHTYLHRFWNLSYSFRHRAQELHTFTHIYIYTAGLVRLGPIFWRLWSIVSSIFSNDFDKRIFHISVVVLKPFTLMQCKKRRWGSESKCYCRPCSWNFFKHIPIYGHITEEKRLFFLYIWDEGFYTHSLNVIFKNFNHEIGIYARFTSSPVFFRHEMHSCRYWNEKKYPDHHNPYTCIPIPSLFLNSKLSVILYHLPNRFMNGEKTR